MSADPTFVWKFVDIPKRSETGLKLSETVGKQLSSTVPYYKVLLQYYSVLQSTTLALLCTTKYYYSTTLLQYYSVLQRGLKEV